MIGQNASANDIRRIVRHKHHEAINASQPGWHLSKPQEGNQHSCLYLLQASRQTRLSWCGSNSYDIHYRIGTSAVPWPALWRTTFASPASSPATSLAEPRRPALYFSYHRACLSLPNCYESPTLSNLQVIQMTMQKCRAVNSALGSKAFVPAPRIQFQAQRRFLQDVAITRTGKPILKVQGGR